MKIVDVYSDNSVEILDEIISFTATKSAAKNVCAVFMNYNENSPIWKKLHFSGVFTTSFEGFVRKILSKSAKIYSSKNISDFSAIEIISSLSKPLLKQHSALKNLVKSKSFPRELYNLFGMFKINQISCDDLLLVSSNAEISKEDKSRFDIIIKIYGKYLEMLANNNFWDFRDSVLNCISELENNNLLKNSIKKNFERIYVFGAENLSEIQLKLLKNITDNLTLIGDNNAKINTFMGANAFSFDNVAERSKTPVNTLSPYNDDIYQRAIFMKNPEGKLFDFQKSNSLKYRLFTDFQDEIDYISKKIIDGVKHGANYSDFAILLRSSYLANSIVDILKKYEIPVSGRLFSDDFELFKIKFERVLMICDIMKKIGAEKFSEFENLSHKSFVDLENLAEQLNLLTENFLSDILENKFDIEKLLSFQSRKKHRFLLSSLLFGLNLLSENDLVSVKNELKNLSEFYSLYLKNDFVQIASKILDISDVQDENFHKFLAKFLSDLRELSTLKTDVLNEKIDLMSVLNLLQNDLSENLKTENKINLLSIFKSSSKNYKHVFLPALTEGYFPKKSKSTYFISAFANEKISAEIRQKFPLFEKIILSPQDELKDENSLFYVALTRAEESILLSSHKFSDRKQVSPSSYFEQLAFLDAENFNQNETAEIDSQPSLENNSENTETAELEKASVLVADDSIKLSASSINRFLKCPRSFYYTKLLGLKTTSSFTANYGTAVHAVFELVISKHIDDFSKELFLKLGNILFNVKNDRQALIDEGFDEKDVVEELEKLSDLDIEEMHADFESAMDNLEEIGYFDEKPLQGDCEKSFDFVLDDLPKVTFNGFIDAIIRYEDGWRLIDYKTSSDKPNLQYLFSENGVNFCTEKTGKYNENYVKIYDYQIPLYYLACLESAKLENYKENLDEVGYLYVRPKNSPKGESWKDYMPVSEIEQYKQKIIENIKTTVVDKIYQATDFEPSYDDRNCKYCDFQDYCNGKTNEGEV